MIYKLTTVTNITNNGGIEEVTEHESLYELQDYLETVTIDMDDANKEAFLYNCKIEQE